LQPELTRFDRVSFTSISMMSRSKLLPAREFIMRAILVWGSQAD